MKENVGKSFQAFLLTAAITLGITCAAQAAELMISLSVDGCNTWPVRKLIYEGATGYSSTALTKEGDVVVLYEKGKAHYRDTGLSVAIFNKEWLLDGKDISDLK